MRSITLRRSQRPRGLRRGSGSARLLGMRVRFLPGGGEHGGLSRMSAMCCQGGPITRPGEYYRVWCECDREASIVRRGWPSVPWNNNTVQSTLHVHTFLKMRSFQPRCFIRGNTWMWQGVALCFLWRLGDRFVFDIS